jgi:hypothetical protein
MQIAYVDGVAIFVDLFFEQLRKQQCEAPDFSNLQSCLCQLLETHSFMAGVRDTLVCSIAEFLGQKAPDQLGTAYRFTRSSNATYAAVFLAYRYSENPSDIVSEISNKQHFLAHLTGLCYSRSTVKCALSLYAAHLGSVETGQELTRIYSALLFAAQFEPDAVRDCLERHFVTRTFVERNREIAVALAVASETAVTLSVPAIRKAASGMLRFFQSRHGIVPKYQETRLNVIKDLTQLLSRQIPYYRFEFIFDRSFSDVHDPLDGIRKIISFLNSCSLPTISKEVLVLSKRLRCQDRGIIGYLTAKFVLKTASRLFAVVPPLI